MALLDFLKNKEEAKKSAKRTEKNLVAGKAKAKTEKKSESKEVAKLAPVVARPTTGKGGFSYDAVKEPHISEKATYLAEKNQYIFEVNNNFNKEEIKKAISGIYGVNVLSVNIIKIPAKKRRLGKTQGWRKAFKKAIVKIQEGQKIEII